MKLFDKLKNALFEEEYVEIEEKPKKEKIKKEKAVGRERVKITKEDKKKEIKEEPIAKKIAFEKKEEKTDLLRHDDLPEDDYDVPTSSDNTFKFPMMEDEDFKVDNNHIQEEIPDFITEKKYEKSVWDNKKEEKKTVRKEYIEYETKDLSYNNYEEKVETTKFKPSPIISPIYGVLDKNYKKEDVKDKKEIVLTSPYSRDKISVDDVRNKAFGSLENAIEDNPLLEQVEPIEEEEKVLDFTTKRKPRVNNITVGEAEEYFNDLGLEYNKDYVDRDTSNDDKEVVEEDQVDEDIVDEREEINNDNDNDDDNLFDLIDSMYDE